MATYRTPLDIMTGRRERALLAFPSVRRMADLLSVRCREPSWVRMSVASLDRFRTMTGHDDLERLLEQARTAPPVAEDALTFFAVSCLAGYTQSQIAALAMGPKIWFRLNGVPIPWRPLPGLASPEPFPGMNHQPASRFQATADGFVLLALIGSGLYRAELLRLRIGNVGSLDADGHLIPDVESEPLAVQHAPRRGRQAGVELRQGDQPAGRPTAPRWGFKLRITFFTYQARQALLAHLACRGAAGQSIGLDAPLIAREDGSAATEASVARARRLSASLIDTVSDVNVELCRTTGDFFRAWGLPGSRFVGPEEFIMEDFA